MKEGIVGTSPFALSISCYYLLLLFKTFFSLLPKGLMTRDGARAKVLAIGGLYFMQGCLLGA